MEYFEVKVKEDTFKIIPNNPFTYTFSVFNHSTYHTIRRNEAGIWEDIEHRFGAEELPLKEIGDAIDDQYNFPEKKRFSKI